MQEKGTKKHITLLKNFLGDKINSILEIQCGDEDGIKNCSALQDKNLKYIGVDVVDGIIQDNRQYFRDEKNKLFMILDASNEPLPQCGLVVCSGMMEYLPIANIWSLIENIRDSKAKYVAFDYYHSPINDLKINDEINIKSVNKNNNNKKINSKKSKVDNRTSTEIDKSAAKPLRRAINLTQAPFYFPMPNFLIPTDDINHSIALYNLRDIWLYMSWHNDDISKLRLKLFGYLESDFNEIKAVFEKQENGEKLFKEAITAEVLDWDKIYYNEPYKSIVDNNNILTKYVNFLLLIYSSELNRLKEDYPERYEMLTNDNFLWASNIAKEFVRYKYEIF